MFYWISHICVTCPTEFHLVWYVLLNITLASLPPQSLHATACSIDDKGLLCRQLNFCLLFSVELGILEEFTEESEQTAVSRPFSRRPGLGSSISYHTMMLLSLLLREFCSCCYNCSVWDSPVFLVSQWIWIRPSLNLPWIMFSKLLSSISMYCSWPLEESQTRALYTQCIFSVKK